MGDYIVGAKTFLSELKRRRVFRVTVVYAGLAFYDLTPSAVGGAPSPLGGEGEGG